VALSNLERITTSATYFNCFQTSTKKILIFTARSRLQELVLPFQLFEGKRWCSKIFKSPCQSKLQEANRLQIWKGYFNLGLLPVHYEDSAANLQTPLQVSPQIDFLKISLQKDHLGLGSTKSHILETLITVTLYSKWSSNPFFSYYSKQTRCLLRTVENSTREQQTPSIHSFVLPCQDLQHDCWQYRCSLLRNLASHQI
jgi:hypothetical protein